MNKVYMACAVCGWISSATVKRTGYELCYYCQECGSASVQHWNLHCWITARMGEYSSIPYPECLMSGAQV